MTASFGEIYFSFVRFEPMHRKTCRRYDDPEHAHALTFTCYRRYSLLASDRSRSWLVAALADARTRLGFELWGYVIMPEHVHLLIHPSTPAAKVSQILWAIKRPVARQAFDHLRQHPGRWLERLSMTRHDGTHEHRFWQAGGGFDRNVTTAKHAWQVLDYIHHNPVRRGLVERPEDWPWSSAGWYAGRQPVLLEPDGTPPPLDDPL